jgi:hypothetical protein
VLEARELVLPFHAKFGLHTALDESPAHRRSLALELGEFGGVFGRQGLGDGGEKLRRLHDRALQPAERGRKLGCILAAIEIDTEKPRARDPRGNAADIGSHAGIPAGAG